MDLHTPLLELVHSGPSGIFPAYAQVYGLKRLVRGLGSGRQGARQGYALALGKLLSELPAVPSSQVLAIMASELDVSGQAKVRLRCCIKRCSSLWNSADSVLQHI